MSRYRRLFIPGGTYFFTVALADRRSDLLIREITLLRKAYDTVQRSRSFETAAICVLPDHLHAVWVLPDDDFDFSTRWALIKSRFSRALSPSDSRSESKIARREKGIWQRRYWEHLIRDDSDFARHMDYIYYNPVHHGLVARVKDWAHSSFHRDVSRGLLPKDWGGDVRAAPGRYGEQQLA